MRISFLLHPPPPFGHLVLQKRGPLFVFKLHCCYMGKKSKRKSMSAPSAKDLSEQATNDAFHGILNIYGDRKGNSKDTLLCMGKQLDSLWQKLGQAKTKNLNLIKPRQKVNLLLASTMALSSSCRTAPLSSLRRRRQ